MTRHHLIISGTGRAGTSFLMQLFTVLGLDTGFADPLVGIFPNCNAGMERDLRSPDAPYVVKDPRLCDYLDEVMLGGQVMIDHALIPIRDLYASAESRRHVQRSEAESSAGPETPGGLWGTVVPELQEEVLARHFHRLMETLARHDVPTTLLHFPRMINEPEYLYARIAPVLRGMDRGPFLESFQRVARPELVHDFAP